MVLVKKYFYVHPQFNNSDPRIIALGFLVAAICGVLGAVAFISFSDRADGDDGHYDKLIPEYSETSGSNLVGGIRLILLCSVLGCAVFYLLQSEPQRMQLIQQAKEIIRVNLPKDSSRSSRQQMPSRFPSGDWVNHQWTADEAPYLQIRTEVDAQMSADRGSVAVAEQAMKAVSRNPNDPLAMYRWGYISYKRAYRACYHSTSKQRNESVQGDGRDARQIDIARSIRNSDYQMQRIPNPQSYSYSRLIFLLRGMREFTARFVPPANPADIRQGDYLIRYKPYDWDVMQTLARMLATRRNELYSSRAMRYAQDVVRARPQSPQAWQTLGMVYVSSAQINRKNSKEHSRDIAKAILAYQKCLRLAPPDYGPRESLEKAIPELRKHPQFN